MLCIGILWRSTNSVQRGLLNFPIQLDGGFLGHDFRRFASIYSIQPKPLIDRWGVVPVASWGMMAAGIAGLFLANPIVTAEGLDAKAWLALSYIVLAGTVAAFWLYLACLKYISPVTAGLVVCLEPTSAYVFGIMFMNLKLGWIECVGIAMVISQVFILSIRSKERS